MNGARFAAFAIASLVLAATPGPGVVYIVTRTLAQGRRAGLASVAGVALGNLCNALAASLGLAAVVAVSTLALDVVRLAGAAYLLWLGLRTLRRPDRTTHDALPPPAPFGRVLRDGLFVAALNPKTALFFVAFLPPFIDAQSPAVLQSIGYGAAFVAIAAMTDGVYVLAASTAAPRLARLGSVGTAGRYLSAAVYIGLGLLTAGSGSRGHR